MNATQDPTEAHLADVALKQMTWKPGIVRDVSAMIVQTALEHGMLWPDDVKLEGISSLTTADANCIGTAWKNLARAGIIIGTGRFRRSTANHARGRKIFEYRTASLSLARRWLTANAYTFPVTIAGEQAEMNL